MEWEGLELENAKSKKAERQAASGERADVREKYVDSSNLEQEAMCTAGTGMHTHVCTQR